MQLTSFTDYGLRAMMRLATDPGEPLSSAQIADELVVPRNHLTKSMAALSRAGLIVTRRGGGGGAVLARAPEDITLGEIIRALSANHALVECFREDGGRCVLRPRCRLRLKLAGAREAFLAKLDETTLAEVALEPLIFERKVV